MKTIFEIRRLFGRDIIKIAGEVEIGRKGEESEIRYGVITLYKDDINKLKKALKEFDIHD